MPKAMGVLFGANAALLVVNLLTAASGLTGLTHAQRPPDANQDGVQFLKVNVNPTNVPPMVNINPNQSVPKVEVTAMPEIRLPPPSGCDDRKSFQTGIGRAIPGPLMVTYLSLPQQAVVNLTGPGGSQRLDLSSGGRIATAIFLGSGQRLEFDSAVLYSGCLPN